jgi:hypothetical protein
MMNGAYNVKPMYELIRSEINNSGTVLLLVL